MSHLSHLQTHKELLALRARIIRKTREFFWSENFLEVETPLIVRLPGQEPYLHPMRVTVHDETGKEYPSYLHTSPEYAMKKMLAAGFENIFSICKTFRDHESFGGLHNPEFTMIEWYRAGATMWELMDDVERLIEGLITSNERRVTRDELPITGNSLLVTRYSFPSLTFTRRHMRDIWNMHAGINLDDYLTTESMFALCMQKGYAPKDDEPYEDLFYRIFLNEIEPKLAAVQSEQMNVVIIHHYPAQMAALAKLSDTDPRYAERMEVYAHGMELANGFTELTNPDEQLRRLKDEQEQRRRMGKDVYDIDMEFIEALQIMPPAAGIALGIDRLVMALTGCKDIDAVIGLPMSEIIKT